VADAREAALPSVMRGGVRRRPAAGWSGASDGALVRAAVDGSVEAMEELFGRYWAGAHRAAWLVVHDAALAEDVAQEAFLSAVRSLHRFDRRRPFRPWLHRIVVNRAIDHARAREGRREVAAELVGEPPSAAPADSLAPGDVVGALAALPAEQRAVVVLRHLLGYTPGEIARMLRLPRGTVNSRLRRGLDALAGPLRDVAPPRGPADARRSGESPSAAREARP
jgi:RNA polymerase sigma-70 factor, ECF subfamily